MFGAAVRANGEPSPTLARRIAFARAAAAFAKAGRYAQCMICTDGYHQPRIRMLFAMFGMPASAIHVPHGGSRGYQVKMRAREAAAIPYDLVAGIGALWRRRRG